MANTTACPACQRKLRVPDSLIGQQVKCPSCHNEFTAAGEGDAAPPPPPRPEPAAGYDDADDRPSRRSSRRNGDAEDRPGRRSRRDDPDDDRPSRHSRRDDYDDDDLPLRRSSGGEKPGPVQAIAIMLLVGGIWSLVWALMWILGSTCVCLLWPGTYYAVVAGILAIVKASALLGANARNETPPVVASVLMIINFVNADVISGALGIVCLVLLNDPKTKNWFRG